MEGLQCIITCLLFLRGLKSGSAKVLSVTLNSLTSHLTMCFLFRDDTFSDTLSQKADSEASSGPITEDKSSSKDMNSPTDRHSDVYLGR